MLYTIFLFVKWGDRIIKIKHDECQPGKMVKNIKFEKYWKITRWMSTCRDGEFSERSEKYLCGIALKLLKNVNFDIRIIKYGDNPWIFKISDDQWHII